MTSSPLDSKRILERLQKLYGDRADACLQRIRALLDACSRSDRNVTSGWDQRDIVLITYGDQVQSRPEAPLATLDGFLRQHQLDTLINTVHLLPFFPYSSDDGFSVMDFRQVDPKLGSWDDVGQLREHFSLMFDLVLNHASSQSQWFADYLKGVPPYDRYFIECDPQVDLSSVTRPRTSPLLTPATTARGTRHVWTTFSADQVDLNFSEPDVLLEMLDILLFYVSQGATIIRMDAIAYLWKRAGTSCIHLDETHEVVKLMRDVLQAVAPHVLILTETNVPHAENVSYFGDGDEAHLVYQFSLPPLLLDAFVHHDASLIHQWLSTLDAPRPGTNYFNFTASHDGVGVRPLEGLVPSDRLESLVQHVRNRGGRVNTRANADGSHTPYELNITYVDALAQRDDEQPTSHAARFLASQAVMLATQGIPGIYFHSLVGSRNDIVGMRQSDQARRINRHKYNLEELSRQLRDDPLQRNVFRGYQHLLRRRIGHPAFHPDAGQRVLPLFDSQILAFVRTSVDQSQNILVLTSFSEQPKTIDFKHLSGHSPAHDLISELDLGGGSLTIAPGSTAWMACE